MIAVFIFRCCMCGSSQYVCFGPFVHLPCVVWLLAVTANILLHTNLRNTVRTTDERPQPVQRFRTLVVLQSKYSTQIGACEVYEA